MGEMHITGTEVSYLYICHRKLWLFYFFIRMEAENTHVQIGRLIQEETFSRHPKEIPLGDIGVIDWAELSHGIIHETKKARCPQNAEIAQTRYYLWWLRQHNVEVKRCVVHYPKQRKTKTVEWKEEMNMQVMEDLQVICNIVERDTPPNFTRLPWCKSCAYEEYCSL